MTTDELNQMRAKLKREGLGVIQYDDRGLHSYPYDAPWLIDEKFARLYEKIRRHTLVDRNRCYAHYLITEQASKVEGDVLEIGVWRGGTAGMLAVLLPEKTIYLADTFRGVVKSSDWEHYNDKAHDDTSEEIVRSLLDKLNAKNYKILRGVFPEDTGEELTVSKLAYVHIDVDVYESAKDAFMYTWDMVSPGGIVVFDDYGFVSACSGIYKFVNEIKNDPDKLFLQNLNGHAYIIKRG